MIGHLDTPLHLKAHEVRHVRDGKGRAVKCLRGAVWITQANDPNDVVIQAGQSFVLDKPGLALVSAPAGPAMVVIQAATHDVWPMGPNSSAFSWPHAA